MPFFSFMPSFRSHAQFCSVAHTSMPSFARSYPVLISSDALFYSLICPVSPLICPTFLGHTPSFVRSKSSFDRSHAQLFSLIFLLTHSSI
eukprot:UN28076